MKTKTVKLRKDTLAKKFEKLHKVDKEVSALAAHLKTKGFRPQKEKKNFWGVKTTHEDGDKKAIVSVYIQDYTKPKSKDGGCVGQVAIAVGDRSDIYSFSLIAPEGDVKRPKEYRVDKALKVLEADSFWDCVWAEAGKHAPTVLGGALVPCALSAQVGGPFSWAVFLSCMALALGGVFFWAVACCDCNCRWYCSWLGCCRY